jgi:hypothetical protein
VTNDLDLVRDLLIRAEDPEGFSTTDPKTVYHVRLLKQAGLVQAIVTPGKWKDRFTLGILKRLTPDGRQFLHAARNETIWNRVKRDFIRPGIFFSLRLIGDYLKQQEDRTPFSATFHR